MISSNEIEAYPCSWPVGRPRTPANRRERARFNQKIREYSSTAGAGSWLRTSKLTIAVAIRRVRDELTQLGATDVVISTNVRTQSNGLPYSNVREPEDSAVAIYFRLRGKVRCLPCDHWDRVADNLAAIAAHIHALRGIERWAVGDIEQAWEGYKALPALGLRPPWWQVLGFQDTPAFFQAVEEKRRTRLLECHPDKGGSANQAAEINAAFDEAKAYFGKG